MRKATIIAYEWFVSHVKKPITPDELEKMTGIIGAGGPPAIIRSLRNMGLTTLYTQKSGQKVDHYWLEVAPTETPPLVSQHYERLQRVALNKEARKPKAKETPAIQATGIGPQSTVIPNAPVVVSKSAERAAKKAAKIVAEAAARAAKEAAANIVHVAKNGLVRDVLGHVLPQQTEIEAEIASAPEPMAKRRVGRPVKKRQTQKA